MTLGDRLREGGQAKVDAFFRGLFAKGPLTEASKAKMAVEFGMTMEAVNDLEQRYVDPRPLPPPPCAHDTVWDATLLRGRCRKCGMLL